jgi:class 3 adenylate cyclase
MTAQPPAKSRHQPRLALGLWTLTMALCLAGFVFLFVTLDVPVGEVYGSRGATGIVAVPFATMGALLAARRPGNPIGWLLAVAGLCTGFVVFGEGYATYSFARHGSSLPLTDPIAWLQNWMWVPLVAFGLVYPFLLFPQGRLPSRRWRWLSWAAPPVMLAFGLSIAFDPGQLQSVADGFVNPYAVSTETTETAVAILGPPFLAVVTLAVVALAGRFRHSTGDEHEQMKWLLFAGTLTTVSLALNIVAGLAGVDGIPYQAIAIFTQVSIGGIAIAAGVAVLKYRLYDIEVVINRAMVFAIVTGFVTAAYVGIVVGVGALVGSWGGSNVALPILATAFVAVAFQPVRHRAHGIANRIVYGKRRTPYEALTGLSAGGSLEDLLPQIARVATESTAARRSIVWLSTGLELRPVASWPEDGPMPGAVPIGEGQPPAPADADHTYSLIHQGDLLGAITIRMGAGETLPPADNRLLSDLAAHAAVTLRGALEAVPLPTGIVTFLMTDIEGSTRLWEADPISMGVAMREHDALVRQIVADSGGILLKWRGEGDSTFSVFTSAAEALVAAATIHDAIDRHPWPTTRPLSVRAALHTGEAELRERDYFGPAVNRCARLRALAHGGQTLVSAATRELVRDNLPQGVVLLDLGDHELKDLSGTERVYEIRRTGDESMAPASRQDRPS